MKKAILYPLFLAALVCASFLKSNAQPPAGEGPMGPPPELNNTMSTDQADEISRIQTDWMKKKLKLNGDQQKAVEKITREHAKKILVFRKKEGYKATTDPEKLAADKVRDEALKGILTEKQFSRYTKNKSVLENSFEITGTGIGMPPPPGM